MRRLSLVLVVFSLLGLSAASAIAATHVQLSASLSGSKHFPRAHGSSRFERKATNRELDVMLSGVKRLAGHRVVVRVAGKKVGTMHVSAAGTAHRHWSTADGHTVPVVSAGEKIRISTLRGTLVASGSYHRDNDH